MCHYNEGLTATTGGQPLSILRLYASEGQNHVLTDIQLVETCHIISAQLDGELSPADLEVLEDEIDFFVVRDFDL